VSGHLEILVRKRGPVFYVKWRDANGQHKKVLGPAWLRQVGSDARGRPVWKAEHGPRPEGYLSERDARAMLEELKVAARKGLASRPKTFVSFRQAAEEWLHHGEIERALKPSTVLDYRSALKVHLLPAFGEEPIESIGARQVERWRSEQLELALRSPRQNGRVTAGLSPRSANKLTSMMHSIFELARRRHDLARNPIADIQRVRERVDPTNFDFYSPEEIESLVRHAGSEQGAAIVKTAAFTGLRRGELMALRWRDVDFARSTVRVNASYAKGSLTAPKSRKGRAVPLVPELAEVLARLATRGEYAEDDDLVFVGTAGGYLDASALRRRYMLAQEAAGLRPLRFHDLRHTFGSLAINRASQVQVQAWMGHADMRTTARYLHHKYRADDAALLAGAFRVTTADDVASAA
jgi:integrase